MRKLLTLAVFVVTVFGTVATAQAGWVIEGSIGKGGRVKEPRGWEPTNVMGVVGYEFLSLIRPELGVVADLGDVKNSKFDLQLRPMLGIYPPILPLYARAIFLVKNLLNDVDYGIGAAGGFKIGLPLDRKSVV